MVAALKALQRAALALPGVKNAEAMASVLSLAKMDDTDPASISKVLCPLLLFYEQVIIGEYHLLYAARVLP